MTCTTRSATTVDGRTVQQLADECGVTRYTIYHHPQRDTARSG